MNVILTKTKLSDETPVNYVTVLMGDVPPIERSNLWDAIYEWCSDTLTDGAWSPNSSGDRSAGFLVLHDAEAIAFKLRWHGVTTR